MKFAAGGSQLAAAGSPTRRRAESDDAFASSGQVKVWLCSLSVATVDLRPRTLLLAQTHNCSLDGLAQVALNLFPVVLFAQTIKN